MPFIVRVIYFSVLACVALCGAGCSTPGKTHVYVASLAEEPIVDLLPGAPNEEIPTFLISVNELYGITYDPFTDHLFLRSYPGDFVQVIDRPARTIKRRFLVKDLPQGRGDLAIRSIDRHLFFVHPNLPALVETTLYGDFVRIITLEGLQSSPAGVAYDQKNDRLLILVGGDLAHVDTYALTGTRLGGIALDRNVRLGSLAYDSVEGEIYVPLTDPASIGIFDQQGRLLRTLAAPAGRLNDFVDVGPRSLLRLF